MPSSPSGERRRPPRRVGGATAATRIGTSNPHRRQYAAADGSSCVHRAQGRSDVMGGSRPIISAAAGHRTGSTLIVYRTAGTPAATSLACVPIRSRTAGSMPA